MTITTALHMTSLNKVRLAHLTPGTRPCFVKTLRPGPLPPPLDPHLLRRPDPFSASLDLASLDLLICCQPQWRHSETLGLMRVHVHTPYILHTRFLRWHVQPLFVRAPADTLCWLTSIAADRSCVVL